MVANHMDKKVEEIYPLSYGQKALWFLYQWAPESAAYNAGEALRIRSEVNIPALRKAFQHFLDRHPCLRTTFFSNQDGFWQKVNKESPVCFEQLDVSGYTQHDMDQFILQRYRRPFNLIEGPVFRVELFTLTPTDHILMITIHHIVDDYPSFQILVKEFIPLYELAKDGKQDTLPPEPLTYADFVRWQNDFPATAEGKAQEAYWLRQLSGDLPVLNLPTDFPRPLRQSFRGLTVRFDIPTDLTGRLKQLARLEGTTLFRVLMAAYQLLLYKYCNQDEILVSTSTSGRLKGKFNGIFGYFVNTVVLRAFINKELLFKEFLTQVEQTTKQALAHQDYPFPHLIELLHPCRDPGRDPIVQTDFTYRKPRGELLTILSVGLPEDTDALRVEYYPLDSQEGQFDLALDIIDADTTLMCFFKTKTDLFEVKTLERMSGHFRVLLEGITADPTQRVADLPLLTSEEEYRLLREFNDTQVDYPKHLCLHHLFEESAAHHPQTVAVEFAGQQLTYAGLNRKANQLAHHLQALGVKPEITVGIYTDRSIETIIGILGVLKAGGTCVLLDPIYPPKRLGLMLAEAGISLILTAEKYRSVESFFKVPSICLDTDSKDWSEQSYDNPLSGVRPENLAYITYTSGSTGRPKGVMVEHRSVVNHNYTIRDQFELTDTDRVLQFYKINSDVFLEEIFSILAAGGTLILPRAEDLASMTEFQSFIQKQKLTVLNIPSSFWQTWVADLDENRVIFPERLRLVIIGSERVDLASFEKWQHIAPDSVQLINAFGLTETTITATLWKSNPSLDTKTVHTVPIGRPLANIQVYILNTFGQLCPIGVPGELHLGGACLARGYKNRPELNDRTFIKNPWSDDPMARLCKTGDLARYLPDGTIEYLGRSDNQIKIRGYRIELEEIEAVLGEHPLIAENAVIVQTSDGGEARLIAYLVLHRDQVIDKEAIQVFLSERLPEPMIPSAFISLPTLPVTINGGIDRQALANLMISRELLSDDAFVAPRNDDEFRLAEIWKGLLGLEKVSVLDNFFNLGGHSLLAVQLTSKISQAFKVDLPLPYLFQSPTIAGIARAIRQAPQTRGQSLALKTDLENDQRDQQHLAAILKDFPSVSLNAGDMLMGIESILITGMTGFLGSFLLNELLRQTHAQIYCLVRPDNNSDPFLKIKKVLESYSLWQEEYAQRIIPVTGDLARPLLGLEGSLFDELASNVEIIYHSGAWVNHLYPYSVLKATNVSGTLEVIRLAAAIRVKPLHYISTLHGLTELDHEQDLEKKQFFNGYVRSKWKAENMVRRAGDQGLPVSIYRPSRVTGHQQTGVSNVNDFLNLLIKGCIQLGQAPQWGPLREYLTPVDYVSRAIVHLSRQRGNYGKVFDLLHTHPPVSWDELLFEQLPSLGYDLEQVSYPGWRKALSSQPTNALYPLLSLFPDREYFLEAEGRGGTSWEVSPSKDFQNTLTGLADSGIVCPPFNNDLLNTYLSYFKNGFL